MSHEVAVYRHFMGHPLGARALRQQGRDTLVAVGDAPWDLPDGVKPGEAIVVPLERAPVILALGILLASTLSFGMLPLLIAAIVAGLDGTWIVPWAAVIVVAVALIVRRCVDLYRNDRPRLMLAPDRIVLVHAQLSRAPMVIPRTAPAAIASIAPGDRGGLLVHPWPFGDGHVRLVLPHEHRLRELRSWIQQPAVNVAIGAFFFASCIGPILVAVLARRPFPRPNLAVRAIDLRLANPHDIDRLLRFAGTVST